MQPLTNHGGETREDATGYSFVSLDREARAAVDTETAAFHLAESRRHCECGRVERTAQFARCACMAGWLGRSLNCVDCSGWAHESTASK